MFKLRQWVIGNILKENQIKVISGKEERRDVTSANLATRKSENSKHQCTWFQYRNI